MKAKEALRSVGGVIKTLREPKNAVIVRTGMIIGVSGLMMAGGGLLFKEGYELAGALTWSGGLIGGEVALIKNQGSWSSDPWSSDHRR